MSEPSQNLIVNNNNNNVSENIHNNNKSEELLPSPHKESILLPSPTNNMECPEEQEEQAYSHTEKNNTSEQQHLQEDKQLPSFKQEDYNEPSLKESNVKSVNSISISETAESLLEFFKNYEADPDYIDLEKLSASGSLKLKKYKESVFYGEFLNGKRHGMGIMVYNNQRVYEGSWASDYKHGKGLEKFPNGCQYSGTYINGKPEGLGRYQWLNGEFYEGEWLNGIKHGSGMWRGAKGDSYVGEWKFGKADGFGVHTWINGDRYEGNFSLSLKHGQGTEKFANGDIYKGNYEQGKPSGFGEYYWANGSYFKGAFKKGLRDGQGIWKKSTGNSDKYEGEYQNDQKSGYGIFSWASGNVYKGNYKNDSRNGQGEMYWTDGSCYKGEWQDGIQHGMGEIYIPGEGVKRGLFKDNTLIHLEEQEKKGKHYDRAIRPPTNHSKKKKPSILVTHSGMCHPGVYKGKKELLGLRSNHKGGSSHDAIQPLARTTFRSRAQSSSKCNFLEQSGSLTHNNHNLSVDEARAFRLSSGTEERYSTLNPLISAKKGKGKRMIQLDINDYGRGLRNRGGPSFVSTSQHQERRSQMSQGLYFNKKERAMHSAFYMHQKLHNLGATGGHHLNNSKNEESFQHSHYTGTELKNYSRSRLV